MQDVQMNMGIVLSLSAIVSTLAQGVWSYSLTKFMLSDHDRRIINLESMNKLNNEQLSQQVADIKILVARIEERVSTLLRFSAPPEQKTE